MVARRIIGCLDVREGRMVKGVKFADHADHGDPVGAAQRYADAGIDELVVYDISASPRGDRVSAELVSAISRVITVPLAVAGGIRSVADAHAVLQAGADKISINSPALANPGLITQCADAFGSQCVVVGVDSSRRAAGQEWKVNSLTGSAATTRTHALATIDWVRQACERGAGEIVLNAMGSDGMRAGFDTEQVAAVRAVCPVPLIASGGGGAAEHAAAAFDVGADGVLFAGALHDGSLKVSDIKRAAAAAGWEVRT